MKIDCSIKVVVDYDNKDFRSLKEYLKEETERSLESAMGGYVSDYGMVRVKAERKKAKRA